MPKPESHLRPAPPPGRTLRDLRPLPCLALGRSCAQFHASTAPCLGCAYALPRASPTPCPQAALVLSLRSRPRFAFVHARASSSCSMCDSRIVLDCSAPGRPAVPECSRPLPRVLPPIVPDVTRYSPSFCRPSVARTNDLPRHGRPSSIYRLGTKENICGR